MVPLNRDIVTFLNASDPAAALRWAAANLSPADQAKLHQINTLPKPAALQYIAQHVPAGKPAPTTPPKQTSYPVISSQAQYGAQEAGVNQQYGQQIAANDYARTLAQQRHARQTGAFNTAQEQARNSVDDPYLRRGIFNSGIRQQGLTDFYNRESQQAGDMQLQQNQELSQLALQRQALQQQQQTALNKIKMAQQQDVYNQLQTLKAAGVKAP